VAGWQDETVNAVPGALRAVVTDLDGTVVRSDGSVGDATAAAFAELAASGVPLLVATGRTPYGLRVLGPLTQHVDLAVCASGSLGYAPASDELLWRHPLQTAVIELVVRCLMRALPDAGIGLFDGRGWAVTQQYRDVRGAWPTGPRRVVPPSRLGEFDGSSLVVAHPNLTSGEIAAALAAEGVGHEHATLTWASPRILDIVAPEVDKGVGLRQALAMLGIEPGQVIVFGDGINDLPLFAAVGCSVAVANAEPALLAVADLIAPSNDEDGVARMLRRLVIAPEAEWPEEAAAAP
jgi:Cof subfamily protein (haloacid dehalogenase superfamily)